jgi:hypothetical protein
MSDATRPTSPSHSLLPTGSEHPWPDAAAAQGDLLLEGVVDRLVGEVAGLAPWPASRPQESGRVRVENLSYSFATVRAPLTDQLSVRSVLA